MIRTIVLSLALALAHPALAQTSPPPAPKPSPTKPSATKPSPAKPAAKKPEPPKPAAAAQSGPCIGVIPHVGERFEVQTIGLFSWEYKKVPIEAWELDDVIVARVRAAAGARFAVRRITYSANAFEQFDHPSLFHPADLKSVVQTIAGAAGCERYVVVLRTGSPVVGPYAVEGFGIVNFPRLTGSATCLFALTALFVLDGHTFDIVRKGAGSISNGNPLLDNLLRTSPISGPNRQFKDFPWPPQPDAVMGLRDPTRALLAESLDKVLPKLLARDAE